MCSTPPSPVPLRILVTDDHEWIRRIAVEIVRQTLPDADVVEKEDGLQALEAFQREKCDFLVTNHHMPHMNGMTLIREVRKQVPDLPVLMISIDPDAKSDAMAAGADWFLTKEELMERMPPLLLHHARRHGSAAAGQE